MLYIVMRTNFTFNSLGSPSDGLVSVGLYSTRKLPDAVANILLADSLPLRFEFQNYNLTPVRFKYFVSSIANLSGESLLKRACGSSPSENEEDDLFSFLFD